MVERARAESQNHWFTYNEQMSVESVAQAVSNLAIQFSGDYDSKEPTMVKYKLSKHYLFVFINLLSAILI